jgi:hypothetical protein
MTPQARAQLENILGSRVTSRIANRQEFSGPELQRVLSELNTVQGRFSASPDADQRAISQALGIARDAMRSAAGRQNTQLGQELGGVNRAYGELADYENAMNRAGVSEMGATPRQIEAAMRQGDRTVRRRATAAGNARNQDFVQAGVNVLPQTYPDSGSVGRALTGLGVGSGAYMIDPTIAITGATTTGLGMAAYSRPAMELYNRALNRSISAQERRFAAERLGVLAMQDPNLAPLIRSLRDATAISGGIASGQ